MRGAYFFGKARRARDLVSDPEMVNEVKHCGLVDIRAERTCRSRFLLLDC